MDFNFIPASQYYLNLANRVAPISFKPFYFPVQIDGTTFYGTSSASVSSPKYHIDCEEEVHAFLKTLKLSKNELMDNGYPFFPEGERMRAIVRPTKYTIDKKIWLDPKDNMRECCRCKKIFEFEKNRECKYHRKEKRFYQEGKYRSTAVFEMSQFHVFDQLSISELNTFITTEKPKWNGDRRSRRILAIDAEMVYTTDGPALARLSVVNWEEKLIMDCKVNPAGYVIDANTEFSGLTIDDVLAHKDTLKSCQKKFLELANEDTILVGHSLECDLTALRLIHYNVIDTSILYKKEGRKVALRSLAFEHLGLRIQLTSPNQHGHDSEEDARVCLQLLKRKIFH